MKHLACFLTTGFYCLQLSALANPIELHVTADRVNLRARADLNAEHVGQVNRGEVLQARELGQEWIPVIPPSQAPAWVHQEFIQDGVVQPRTLNVRSGPGMNHAVLGAIERGVPVRVVGTFGEWLQIVPTSELTVFVHRDYVEIFRPAERVARAQNRPALSPTPSSQAAPLEEPQRSVRRRPTVTPIVVQPVPEQSSSRQRMLDPVRLPVESGQPVPFSPTPPPQPSGLVTIRSEIPTHWRLIPLEGQGKEVEQQGVLRYHRIALGMPTRHRLTQPTDVGPATLCFLHGNRDQLRDWVGSELQVRGREYWLEGYRHPVIVLEQISPIAP